MKKELTMSAKIIDYQSSETGNLSPDLMIINHFRNLYLSDYLHFIKLHSTKISL
jgi:hypothetical protein